MGIEFLNYEGGQVLKVIDFHGDGKYDDVLKIVENPTDNTFNYFLYLNTGTEVNPSKFLEYDHEKLLNQRNALWLIEHEYKVPNYITLNSDYDALNTNEYSALMSDFLENFSTENDAIYQINLTEVIGLKIEIDTDKETFKYIPRMSNSKYGEETHPEPHDTTMGRPQNPRPPIHTRGDHD
jgi:hypothetical protein